MIPLPSFCILACGSSSEAIDNQMDLHLVLQSALAPQVSQDVFIVQSLLKSLKGSRAIVCATIFAAKIYHVERRKVTQKETW